MKLEHIDIWDLFIKGDEKSFKSIYDDHYEILINYGYKFTTNLPAIEDAIQTLFIKMWKNRLNLNKPSSLKHYLLKAFRNTLIYNLQSESRGMARINSSEHLRFDLDPTQEENIINMEEADIQKQFLAKRMLSLTNRQREAIYLRFYQELSYEEVAAILKMEVGGTYKLIYRAIERLRNNP